jgi:hypothetical protein
MIKKFIPWIIFLIVVSFIIGVVIGAQWSNQQLSLTAKAHDSTQVMYDIALLNLLRTNGTPKAIGDLENKLDSDLVNLDESTRNAPISGPASQYIDVAARKFIADAEEYRKKFPHSNCDTNIDLEISNLFLLVNSSTNK